MNSNPTYPNFLIIQCRMVRAILLEIESAPLSEDEEEGKVGGSFHAKTSSICLSVSIEHRLVTNTDTDTSMAAR